MRILDIVKKPVITEKTLKDASGLNVYTFQVNSKANKNQIKVAIEQQFGVTVLGLNTVTIAGKTKRKGYMRRNTIHTSPRKKALVKLKEGDKIELFDIGG